MGLLIQVHDGIKMGLRPFDEYLKELRQRRYLMGALDFMQLHHVGLYQGLVNWKMVRRAIACDSKVVNCKDNIN